MHLQQFRLIGDAKGCGIGEWHILLHCCQLDAHVAMPGILDRYTQGGDLIGELQGTLVHHVAFYPYIIMYVHIAMACADVEHCCIACSHLVCPVPCDIEGIRGYLGLAFVP